MLAEIPPYELKDVGAIELRNRRIHVTDSEALERVARNRMKSKPHRGSAEVANRSSLHLPP